MSCAPHDHRARTLAEQLADAADRPGPDLAAPAFLIARLEYPRLDPGPYLDRLESMGDAAFHRIAADPGHDAPLAARIDALNRYLFNELGFFGNRDQYEDPRNSCLNEVLDRRTGIPITLSLVYIEVARRAGMRAEGINFPGPLPRARAPRSAHRRSRTRGSSSIRSTAGRFSTSTTAGCCSTGTLARRRRGQPALLARATRRQILVRMLLNLKRLYVSWRSFPQARLVADLLLALSPRAVTELRDRGLLAYHMNDFPPRCATSRNT